MENVLTYLGAKIRKHFSDLKKIFSVLFTGINRFKEISRKIGKTLQRHTQHGPHL